MSAELDEPGAIEQRTLSERAARAAESEPRALDADDIRAIARFPIGALVVAIELRSLRAAIPLRTVTPVPLAPPSVIGILRYDGVTLTALSLASLLSLGGLRRDPAVLLVVELAGGRLVAFDAEEIPRVDMLRESAIRAAVHHPDACLWEVSTDSMQILRLLDLEAVVRRFDGLLSRSRDEREADVAGGTDGS